MPVVVARHLASGAGDLRLGVGDDLGAALIVGLGGEDQDQVVSAIL